MCEYEERCVRGRRGKCKSSVGRESLCKCGDEVSELSLHMCEYMFDDRVRECVCKLYYRKDDN